MPFTDKHLTRVPVKRDIDSDDEASSSEQQCMWLVCPLEETLSSTDPTFKEICAMLSSGDPEKEAEAVLALKYQYEKKRWSVFKQVYSPYRLDCLVQGSNFSEDSKDELAAQLETFHKLFLENADSSSDEYDSYSDEESLQIPTTPMAVPAAISTSPNACSATAVVTEDEETDAIAAAFQEAVVQDMLDTVAVFKDEEYKEKMQEASMKHTAEKEELEADLQATSGQLRTTTEHLKKEADMCREKDSIIQEHETTIAEMAHMAQKKFAPAACTVIREAAVEQGSVFATWTVIEVDGTFAAIPDNCGGRDPPRDKVPGPTVATEACVNLLAARILSPQTFTDMPEGKVINNKGSHTAKNPHTDQERALEKAIKIRVQEAYWLAAGLRKSSDPDYDKHCGKADQGHIQNNVVPLLYKLLVRTTFPHDVEQFAVPELSKIQTLESLLDHEEVAEYIDGRRTSSGAPLSASSVKDMYMYIWPIVLNHPLTERATFDFYHQKKEEAKAKYDDERSNKPLTEKENANSCTPQIWKDAWDNMETNLTETYKNDKKAQDLPDFVHKMAAQGTALLSMNGEFLSRNELAKTVVMFLESDGTLTDGGTNHIKNFSTDYHAEKLQTMFFQQNVYIHHNDPNAEERQDMYFLAKFKSAAGGNYKPEFIHVPANVRTHVWKWLVNHPLKDQKPMPLLACKNKKGKWQGATSSAQYTSLLNTIFHFSGKKISSQHLRRYLAITLTSDAIKGILPIVQRMRHSLDEHVNKRYLLEAVNVEDDNGKQLEDWSSCLPAAKTKS